MLRALLMGFAAVLAFTAFEKVDARENAIQHESVPGEYVVKLNQSLSVRSSSIEELSRQTGMHITSVIPTYNMVVVSRPSFERSEQGAAVLSSHPAVAYAEPNYIFRRMQTEDEHFAKQWGLLNVGQPDSAKKNGVAGIDINAVPAWNIETGSKDVVVAVIDTGVDYNNQDLKENMWVNEAELNGAPNVDDDGNGYVDDVYGHSFITGLAFSDPMDDHGHGSHCAGVIGARTNNTFGMAGVNWDVRLMAVKFLDKNGSGALADAVKAIEYSVKNGATILSNSWGGGPFTQALFDIISDANDKGVLFIAAAGNSSANNDSRPAYPASYAIPNVVSVAAIDNQGKLASFSSYGKKSVHVGAPGVNILSMTTKGFESWSGTSMATPHVAGVAALLAAHQPEFTHHEIKGRMLATTVRLDGLRNRVSTAGMISAYNTLMNVPTPADPNDPALWNQAEMIWSTPHPYVKNSLLTFEVSVPEAKEMALYFSRFDIENRYDWVELYDATGTLITKYTGNMDDSYSESIKGNYVKIVFKSDSMIEGYGVDLTKVGWR